MFGVPCTELSRAQRVGQSTAESVQTPTIRVVTGRLDDPRKPLAEGHALYEMALRALVEQDSWTFGEHAAFWAAALVAWPTDGRPVFDHLSAAAAHLRERGLGDLEITDALGVAAGTVRRAPSDGRRERPSHARGAGLLLPRDGCARCGGAGARPCWTCHTALTLGRRLNRALVASECEDVPPLPRVFVDEDAPPQRSFVNPLLGGCGYAPNPAGPRYFELAHAHLHALWAREDPRVRPGGADGRPSGGIRAAVWAVAPPPFNSESRARARTSSDGPRPARLRGHRGGA